MKFAPRRFLSSKILLSLGVIFLIFLLISFGREFYRRYYLEQEIKSLQSQVNQLEGKNQEFGSLIEYLNTQNFTEEEARLKIGLKKPGEEVVVINQPGSVTPGDAAGGADSYLAQLSNPVKWWYYFFKSSNI